MNAEKKNAWEQSIAKWEEGLEKAQLSEDAEDPTAFIEWWRHVGSWRCTLCSYYKHCFYCPLSGGKSKPATPFETLNSYMDAIYDGEDTYKDSTIINYVESMLVFIEKTFESR